MLLADELPFDDDAFDRLDDRRLPLPELPLLFDERLPDERADEPPDEPDEPDERADEPDERADEPDERADDEDPRERAAERLRPLEDDFRWPELRWPELCRLELCRLELFWLELFWLEPSSSCMST